MAPSSCSGLDVPTSSEPPARRVAVVDIGTNSVLMLLAERAAAGELERLCDEAIVTRLGQGVDRSRRLDQAAIERTLACLRCCGAQAGAARVQRVAAIATSVLRDATNGTAFLDEAERTLGVRPSVLSGEDEAALTFEGALGGLGLGAGAVTVCDLGGGSTELVAGFVAEEARATMGEMRSFDLGCVRATERHLVRDPPTAAEITRLRSEARAVLAGWPVTGPSRLVAVGGSATTLAAIVGRVVPYDPAKIHGVRLSRVALRRAIDRLAALPLSDRKTVRGLEPGRADVIVAGAVLLDEVVERIGAPELWISDRGLRWGVAARMVSGRPVTG